ncbi:MAG: hypothetical protein L3J97_06225 [Thermoplasmata archaeon]|nr:hypothetical protein [Thermoplasmata archaeon]
MSEVRSKESARGSLHLPIVEFLTRLQTDYTFLSRYRSNPEETMHAFGLTPHECATLREGDAVRVRALLGEALGGDYGRTAHLHVHLHIPPPPHPGP